MNCRPAELQHAACWRLQNTGSWLDCSLSRCGGHWTGQYPGLANPYQFFLFSGPDLLGLGSPAQAAPVRQQQQIKVSSSQSCQGGGLRWEYFLSVLPSRLIINLLGISQLSTRQNIKAIARIIGNGKELFYSALWKTAAAVDVAVST